MDLTAGGSATFAGAIWSTNDQQTTGTGVIQPFLRLQANGTETGLNSNEGQANLLADTKQGSWTHDITLSQIGSVTLSGVPYYSFFLDINQNNSSPLLSLDTFSLYTRPTSITDGAPDTLAAVLSSGGVLRYSLDAGGDTAVLLDYSLNPGSGAGDLYVYVPTSLFGSAAGTDFVYLYSQFGMQPGYEANDGYEEWAVAAGLTSVPDGGGTIILLGLGLLTLPFIRRFARA